MASFRRSLSRPARRRSKAWRNYEEVARHVLTQLAARFDLASVEGEQTLPGKSGTRWNIEAKAVRADGGGFLIVECRRYARRRLSQEAIGGLAFRILDTGGIGGIIVSPLPLQKGAQLIATASRIIPLRLDADSTAERYIARFLDTVFVGVTDTAGIALTDSATVVVVRG